MTYGTQPADSPQTPPDARLANCTCHGTPTPLVLLDRAGRCLWDAACELAPASAGWEAAYQSTLAARLAESEPAGTDRSRSVLVANPNRDGDKGGNGTRVFWAPDQPRSEPATAATAPATTLRFLAPCGAPATGRGGFFGACADCGGEYEGEDEADAASHHDEYEEHAFAYAG